MVDSEPSVAAFPDGLDPDGFDATSAHVDDLLRATFDGADHERVRAVLQRLGGTGFSVSRARLEVAALLVADGRMQDLVYAVDLGLTDYRDLLVGAFYPDAFES